MDIGSHTLCQTICDKLLNTYTSKLCVLAVGLSSNLVAMLLADMKPDKRRPINFIVANRDNDIHSLRLALSDSKSFYDHSVSNTKKHRHKNYTKGGIFLVTNMKFSLDVLEELIDPSLVDKVLLVNEYSVGEYNPLALAVNILKRANEVDCMVKA
jgi:hypothetical protein